MRCPVCETENHGAQCVTCGKALDAPSDPSFEVTPIEGLEATQLAPLDLAVRVEPLPGVEHTQLAPQMDVAQHWTAGPIALERTEHEPVADAPAGAGADLDLEPGREPESADRTAAPIETAICPFCGTPSLDAVCDVCGRRKLRFTGPQDEAGPAASASGDIRVCPSCFARVPKEVRCSDCGMPFPLTEL
jgi:hypothetical protein